MAIKIYNNKIMIGDYTLEESNTGIVFDGVIQTSGIRREGNFQGETFGFVGAGYTAPVYPINVIDKYPFSVDSNATDLGDLSLGRFGSASMSSDLHGYTAGGYTAPTARNVIDKFKFATNGNATDVGDLSETKYTGGGNSCKRVAQGFAAGDSLTTGSNVMNRVPFVSDTNAYDIGDLSVARGLQAAQSSETHGYNSGGEPVNVAAGVNTIDKFPMIATNYVLATDVGDLTQARTRFAGQSSTTHGYSSGGIPAWPAATWVNTIDKFPFSSDTNATSVGTLSQARGMGGGSSSQISGYNGGGVIPPGYGGSNTIDKFPFATDSSASSVGTLTSGRGLATGFQV